MLRAQAHRQHTLTIGLPIMAAALGLLIAASPHSARAQAPADLDPTGGLREGVDSGATTVGMTREELVRKWDLDGNGTIDQQELRVMMTKLRVVPADVAPETIQQLFNLADTDGNGKITFEISFRFFQTTRNI